MRIYSTQVKESNEHKTLSLLKQEHRICKCEFIYKCIKVLSVILLKRNIHFSRLAVFYK